MTPSGWRAVPVMGRFVDLWGKRFTSPAKDYKPGQFTPTGARCTSIIKPRFK